MEINFNKKIGNLELCPVTYLGGKKPDTLEICQWDKNDTRKWTILTFRYNMKEEYFYIEECGENDRTYLLNLLDEYGVGYIVSYPEYYKVITDYAEAN